MTSYQIIAQYVNRDNRIPFDDKKDVIQSVYVSILETHPKYINRSYIRRAINHLLIDQHRANKARPTLVSSDVEYGSSGLLPDADVDRIEREIDVLSRERRTKRAKRN